MTVKFLASKRLTALSTDLVGTTVDVAESETPATYTGNANNASRVEASQMQTTVSTGDVISAISANYYQSEGGSTNTVFGIYTNNSGSPQTLLAQTVEGQPTGTGWKTFDLQTPYTVPASVNGQNLWVGVYADGDSNLYSKQSGAGGTKSYNVGSYSSTMPSTFTVSNTYTNVSNMKLVNTPPKLGTTDATPTYPTSGVLPTGSTTTDWTLTDTTISNSALNFNSAQASTQNDGVYDLGSALSNTKWVIRFKYTIANLTNGNQSNVNAFLGLFSGTGSYATSQNYMGLSYYTTSNTNYFWATASPSSNSTIWESSSTGRIYDGSVSATTYYVEIKRTSASTGEISIGTNSDFVTGRTTQTTFYGSISSSITGLRYIGIKNRSTVPTLGSAVFNGTISDIEVYDDVTTVTSDIAVNVQTNTIAEETNTGVHRIWSGSAWVEVA